MNRTYLISLWKLRALAAALCVTVAAFIFLGTSIWAQDEDDNSCIGCHTELGDEYVVPVHEWQESVHAKQGIMCQDCHGGDSEEWDIETAMDPAKGFIGVPTAKQIIKVCGNCHSDAERMKIYDIRTDQLAMYKTSHHGKAVEAGSEDAATCVSCHGNHGIQSPADKRSMVNRFNIPGTCGSCHADEVLMDKVGISHTALEDYEASYHGHLLSKGNKLVPTCADCHGTHGASPPGVGEVAQVCGNCHGNTAENYAKSPHEQARIEYGYPQCIDCHNNHRIEFPTEEMFLGSEDRHCGQCHDDDSGSLVAAAMYAELDKTRKGVEEAQELIENHRGSLIFLESYEESLLEAESKIIEAGPITHSLSVEAVQEKTNETAAAVLEIIEGIQKAKSDIWSRKLAWVVLAVVSVLWAMVLIRKIHQIPNPYERKEN